LRPTVIEQATHKRNLAKDRNIRLFVSSTFKYACTGGSLFFLACLLVGKPLSLYVVAGRDMQAERNLLVKKVFPQVRKVCAERNVNFTEVDLRWGITNEESAGGQVITLCLNEVRLLLICMVVPSRMRLTRSLCRSTTAVPT
jgi:hypothetical protein